MDNKFLESLKQKMQIYEITQKEQKDKEEAAAKKRIQLAERRQREEEERKKFEREARVIYSGTSKSGKTTIYEYEGKYYVGERRYIKGRGSYRRIEIRLSDVEDRQEIAEEEIEKYRMDKESIIDAEKEEARQQREEEERKAEKRIQEVRKQQEREEANRKFERKSRILFASRTNDSMITVYEYEDKYYVGESKYIKARGLDGRIEMRLSNSEVREEATQEEINDLFGNIELHPQIEEEPKEAEPIKKDLITQPKSKITFETIRGALKKVFGKGER